MASSTSKNRIGRGGVSVTLNSLIDERQVRNWEGVFEELGAERFPRALQFSVNRVASDAQEYIGEAIDSIVDRPVEFTRAVKGRKNSSVQTRGRSLSKQSDKLRLRDVRSTVFVMKKQSAYMKFLLGEETRLPGDVGPSKDHIDVPYWSNIIALQGFMPTAEGNIPDGMLEAFHRRKSHPSTAKVNAMEDGPEQRALRRHRTKDRKWSTTFFGRPTGQFGDVQEGWYSRPETWYERSGPVIQTGKNKGLKKLERHGGGAPRLLTAALQKTHHKPILANAWDKAVEKAAQNLGNYIHAELNDRLAWQARHADMGKQYRPAAPLNASDYEGANDFLA